MGNLQSAVDELAAVEFRDMPLSVLGDEIGELYRQATRLHAVILERLEVFDRGGGAAATHHSTHAWLRDVTGLSSNSVSRDVLLGRDLADRLPACRRALADGDLTVEKAQQIASLKKCLSDEQIRACEQSLVEFACQSSTEEVRSEIARIRHAYEPDKDRDKDQSDYAARELHASTTIHGMGVGKFTLHPAGMETLMTALHALSKPISGDDRTAAQRRADALITMAELALRSGELPDTGGVAPHVTITCRLDTMRGEPGSPTATAGYGADLGTDWARRFSCDANIARVVFGPRDEAINLGRSRRTFSPAQRRYLVARDHGCIWPGCPAPPAWCDGHHTQHWADLGQTDTDNGVLLCGRHHDRVHLYGHAVITVLNGLGYTIDLRPGSDPRWRRKQPPDPGADPPDDDDPEPTHQSRAGPAG